MVRVWPRIPFSACDHPEAHKYCFVYTGWRSACKVFVKSVAGVVSQRWKHGGIMSMLRRECRKRALGICFPKTAVVNAAERNFRGKGPTVPDLAAYLLQEYDLEMNDSWDEFDTVPRHYGAAWCQNELCWLRPGHSLQWVSYPMLGDLVQASYCTSVQCNFGNILHALTYCICVYALFSYT
jgi:hypothetical protein